MQIAYPAILYPGGKNGGFAVTIPGINVNGQGETMADAIQNATEILQEVIDDLTAAKEELPGPVEPEQADEPDTRICLVMATVPSKHVRVNVTLPDSLLMRIDAVSPNRSAFLAQSALAALRSGNIESAGRE